MKKYSIIYADPPWSYNLFSGIGQDKKKSRAASSHYEVMRFVDIINLPIKEIAEKDCTLFMWATYPMLPEALEVIKRWGFAYKTVAFTWVKKNKKADSYFWGMGSYTRSNPEICILATRGSPRRISKSVLSVVDAKIREHSRKPDEVREKIVQLMGNLPRIELFARNRCEGWDYWGNELSDKEQIDILSYTSHKYKDALREMK